MLFFKLEIIHFIGFYEQSLDGRAYMKMTNAKISNGIVFSVSYKKCFNTKTEKNFNCRQTDPRDI